MTGLVSVLRVLKFKRHQHKIGAQTDYSVAGNKTFM